MNRPVLFVCVGDTSECWNCGGWVHADGCVPEGEPPIADHYCSEECMDEALTFAEQQKADQEARTRCCPSCGFDNQEHDKGCHQNGKNQ